MNYLTLLVWSKNRAAQLDLLLSSIEKYWKNTPKISVLFKADSPFEEGYKLCSNLHPQVNFVPEQSFENQTKELLGDNFFSVSTDDTIVYRPFEIPPYKHLDIFSLRYGLNTTLQDEFTGLIQPALTTYANCGPYITWNFNDYHPHYNFGYPFGLDLHIYSPKVGELIKGLSFKNTNELESKLFYLRDRICPFIGSFPQSVAFNNPMNNLSGVTQTSNLISPSKAESNFCNGLRFQIPNFPKIIGCHQTVEIEMG